MADLLAIEALDHLHLAAATNRLSQITNVTFDADNDSGELIFDYRGKTYVVRADDVRELEPAAAE